MADTQKKSEPKVVLARAAESGDPAVQALLAQREIHAANGQDAKVREVQAALAELGFE